VFPDGRGGYRDRNNSERDFRKVREGASFEWVVPHMYLGRRAVDASAVEALDGRSGGPANDDDDGPEPTLFAVGRA